MMRELVGAAITMGVIAIVVMLCACLAPVAQDSAEDVKEQPMTFEEMQAAFNGEDPHSEEYTK